MRMTVMMNKCDVKGTVGLIEERNPTFI